MFFILYFTIFFFIYANRRPKSNNWIIPAGANVGISSNSSGVAFNKSSSPAIEIFTEDTLSYLNPNSKFFSTPTSKLSIFKYLVPILTSLGVFIY